MPLPEIHPTAWIHPDSPLPAGARIGPFAVVEEKVSLGRDCRIAAHAVIKAWTCMGDGNQVFEHAVIGGAPQDLKFQGEASRVVIGHRNVFREGVTVNRCTEAGGETRIGDDCYLMTGSHVAHECRLADRVILANCVALAGHVSIGERAFLSGGVVVHQFTRIGRVAMVGGNGKVTQDVPPFCLVDGVPARVRGLNLVGLRRAGFPAEEVRSLKEAIRILADRGLRLAERLDRLAQIDSPAVGHLGEFIRQSERGVCPFTRD